MPVLLLFQYYLLPLPRELSVEKAREREKNGKIVEWELREDVGRELYAQLLVYDSYSLVAAIS